MGNGNGNTAVGMAMATTVIGTALLRIIKVFEMVSVLACTIVDVVVAMSMFLCNTISAQAVAVIHTVVGTTIGPIVVVCVSNRTFTIMHVVVASATGLWNKVIKLAAVIISVPILGTTKA